LGLLTRLLRSHSHQQVSAERVPARPTDHFTGNRKAPAAIRARPGGITPPSNIPAVLARLPASLTEPPFRSYRGGMTGTDRSALRALVDQGNEEAADRLAHLAAEDGDVETLKYLIDAGNESAGDLLAKRAAEQGDVETLEYLIGSGVTSAADRRATIASEMGDAATLQRLADEGSEVAQTLLTRTISDTE